jgi:4-nitrophenyl phosphatase
MEPQLSSDDRPIVLCDLDGVVWLSHQPIPGSVDAVARLRAAGFRVLFVTNNSGPLIASHESALHAIGIPAAGDVLSAAMAAGTLVTPGDRVLVCGGPGVVEAVAAAGGDAMLANDAAHDDHDATFDVVVAGIHRWFDYEVMRRAASAIRQGARFIATNDDATYPTPAGLIPGGGAIVAAIAVAAGVAPTIAGKPHQPMAGLVRRVVGADRARGAVMVGDRGDTDGLFASLLGCRYAQVDSGVTPADVGVEPTPDLRAADLASVADRLIEQR